MKLVLALLTLCVCVLAQKPTTEDQFQAFIARYNKVFASKDEYNYRLQVFSDNLDIAAQLQKENPLATFGVTKFMDLTPAEFKQYYLKSDVSLANNTNIPIKTNFDSPSGLAAPDPTNYDWSSAGVITPVYNQGQCGSCWAFSATETIESYWALAGHSLEKFSMEQIVDCDKTCYGCEGGWPYLAYEYVQNAGGIEPYADYTYTAGGGVAGSCKFNSADVMGKVSGYKKISGESGLYAQASSGSGGPVSVCVDASSWQTYTSGVLTKCGTSVDHCVQLTGYANYGSTSAYWRVRNSWATDWGISGYIYIKIGENLCDIGSYATIVDIA